MHWLSFDLKCESGTFYSCNMGTSDLPEMYARSPPAQPQDCRHTFKCPFYSYYITLPLRLIPYGYLFSRINKIADFADNY